MIRTLLLLALLLMGSPPAIGQSRPQPLDGDPQLQTVDYREGAVVLLEVAAGYQLTLELAQDEQIENVALGDSGSWQVTPNRRGDRLFIKPAAGGAATNMTIITSSRLYLVELQSMSGPSPEMAYVVRYRYPETRQLAPSAQVALTGHYRVSGDRSLRPSSIGDDGTHTYITWPDEAPLPAVYSVTGNGQESLVNGNMRGGAYVIDAVAHTLVFRIDDQKARAVRRAPGKAR